MLTWNNATESLCQPTVVPGFDCWGVKVAGGRLLASGTFTQALCDRDREKLSGAVDAEAVRIYPTVEAWAQRPGPVSQGSWDWV